MKKFLFVVALLALITAGCNLAPKNQNQPLTNQLTSPTETSVSFLVSTENTLKYCDGTNIDSEGYKKTITKQVTRSLADINLSQNELINKTIVLAAEEANLTHITSTEKNFIRIKNDIAYIKPIDGWAGVSIFLCAWKPFVETNILYLTNIENVVWMDDLQKWQELNK